MKTPSNQTANNNQCTYEQNNDNIMKDFSTIKKIYDDEIYEFFDGFSDLSYDNSENDNLFLSNSLFTNISNGPNMIQNIDNSDSNANNNELLEQFTNQEVQDKNQVIIHNDNPKESVDLTDSGKEFRQMFYFLDRNNKKIPKKIVKYLYNLVCLDLKMPKMSRAEERSINKFFNSKSENRVEIVNAISLYIKFHPEVQLMIDKSHSARKKKL